MRSHVLVATVLVALASLLLAATAGACVLTSGSIHDVNGTFVEPRTGVPVPVHPGDVVRFTFAGLDPDGTYSVHFENRSSLPVTQIRRDPNGVTAEITVPDLGSAEADADLIIDPVPGPHDHGDVPQPTLAPTHYMPRVAAPAPAPSGGSSAPTGPPTTPQPSSTGQPAGGNQPTTVVTQTTLSQPSPSGSPTTTGHISQTSGSMRHQVSGQQTIRSNARIALTSAGHPAATARSARTARSQQGSRTHRSRAPLPIERTPPQPVAVPKTRGSIVSATQDGGVATAIVVGSILLLLGLAGYGGTRVLARRRPPPAPEPAGATPTAPAFDPIEAELQQMLAEEQVNGAGEERRDAVPV